MTPTLSFERRAVTSLASLYAFRMLGLFMLLPVLSLYGSSYTGSSPLLIGVALGAYGFTQSLLQIPFGIWSDRWGRKPVIAVGLILFALGSLVAAQADSIYELIVGRCLQGGGAIAAAIMALVADLTQDENRTKAMALIGASIGLSFSVALALGPLIATHFGISGIFWVTAGLALIGLVILVRWVPSPKIRSRETRLHRDAGAVPELLWTTLCNPDLLRLNAGIFLLHFTLMASFLVLPPMLEQVGLARAIHWQVYLAMSLFAFLLMVPFVILAEKRRFIKQVFIGAVIALGIMQLAMLNWRADMMFFLLSLFLFFTAFNILEATLPSLMSKAAPAGSKGTASGIYSTSQFLGAFVGGVTGGWLVQDYGVGAVFVLCACAAILWVCIAIFMRPPRFLTSLQVAINPGADVERFVGQLESLPGVAEVVVFEHERAVYLKVDKRTFNREQMQALIEA